MEFDWIQYNVCVYFISWQHIARSIIPLLQTVDIIPNCLVFSRDPFLGYKADVAIFIYTINHYMDIYNYTPTIINFLGFRYSVFCKLFIPRSILIITIRDHMVAPIPVKQP